MPKRSLIPTYRLHKGSGQAVVVLDGQSIYLGVWESPESRAKYERVIAEWLAQGRRSAPAAAGTGPIARDALTVSELILRYFHYAQTYYPPRRGHHERNAVDPGGPPAGAATLRPRAGRSVWSPGPQSRAAGDGRFGLVSVAYQPPGQPGQTNVPMGRIGRIDPGFGLRGSA
jgi:hypothetical protein